MPVTATGPSGKALEAVRDLLAASTDFQAMMGAANLAAAQAACSLQWRTGSDAAPWCHLVITATRDEEIANRVVGVPVELHAVLCWAVETQVGDTDADRTMRALNRMDALRTYLNSAIGTGTTLAKAAREILLPIRTTSDDPDRDAHWRAEIIFTWDY